MEKVHASNYNPGGDDIQSEVSGSKEKMDSSFEKSGKGLNTCFTSTAQNFLNFMQFVRTHPGGLAPPPTGNPGSVPGVCSFC